MSDDAFLGSAGFARVLHGLHLQCVDIGARGGIVEDLGDLAPWIDVVGLEPDAGECERLQESAPGHPYRSLGYAPVAVGRRAESRNLYLYRWRGGSSLLEANQPFLTAFSRGDMFSLDETLEVATEPLDDAAQSHGFADAAYLKIDVQGLELEIFESGPRLVGESLLVVRSEVNFAPQYREQPLFHEVDAHLRAAGFVHMAFWDRFYHWRRTTRTKLPELAPGSLPYSLGQLIHSDALYFRDPDRIEEDDVDTALRAAMLALAHEFVDHAAALLRRPAVASHLKERHGLDVDVELTSVSRHLRQRYLRREWARVRNEFKRIARQRWGRYSPRAVLSKLTRR